MAKARILVAEDDENLGAVIRDYLRLCGYEVTLCHDGQQALQTFGREAFDVCILDVMMPKTDGFEVAARIREANQHIPLLFLTARQLAEDRLTGLRLGADDYITKPFNIEELALRVEVFLRRPHVKETDSQIFSIGRYTFHYREHSLTLDGQTRSLTDKEAEILRIFCLHPNKALKREEILLTVWGDDDYFLGRSLDVFISKLRKYLREDPHVEIQTIHALGFRLAIKNG